MSVEGHDNSIPWYVPGFGKNAGSSFNLTYNLIYNLTFLIHMSLLEIMVIVVSLAIDCFTVSVTSGIILHRIQWGTFLRMAFFFGLFQALMPFLGWLGASRFQSPD